ncbi:MAG: YicC/YloC family endoribonuclease [Gemmatimonadota bacterium]
MALSMTGFGAAEGEVAGRRARVEIRTVNHRWFNLSARLPVELGALETELREALRREFDRGHVTLSVRWSDESAAVMGVDWERAEAVVATLREVRDRFALAGDVTLEMVSRQSDLFGSRREEAGSAVAWEVVAPVVAAACAECLEARRREGAALASEIRGRLQALADGAKRVQVLAPARLLREHTRLHAQLTTLLDGATVDDVRVAQEIALLADRLDITEELVRFGAHLDAADAMLAGEKPVGKALGFLAQELGREVNTMGSKANDPAIAHEVVAMKGELEKIREQLENLE